MKNSITEWGLSTSCIKWLFYAYKIKFYRNKYKNNDVIVYANNKKIRFDEVPFIENNRTLVPLRAIFEALGATVDWSDNTVIAKKENTTISIKIGSKEMTVDGKIKKLDVATRIKNSRTFVPLRAISEAFNNTVNWNGENRVITIK